MDLLIFASAIFTVSCLALRSMFTTCPVGTHAVLYNNNNNRYFLHSYHDLFINNEPWPDVFINNISQQNLASINVPNRSVCYSKAQLKLFNNELCQISPAVLNTLSNFGLSKQTHMFPKTNKRRGKRGGVRKQRKINVLNSNPVDHIVDPSRGICYKNLTSVKISNSSSGNSSNLKFLYFNARSCGNKTL